ncbi:HNH endonuclease, partial [Corynebacterium cystitidis]
AQQATLGPDRGTGYVWTHDPASGEIIGQITLTSTETVAADTGGRIADPGDVRGWDQERVDAEFFALVADLAGAPHEIIDPVTGDVVGHTNQTLYGKRTWHGEQSSPLLFTGQYYDDESGWAYNRFRYYHPDAGVYNAQDPLGAGPRIASAQGYVNHPAHWVDILGLMAHTANVQKVNGRNPINSRFAGREKPLSQKGIDAVMAEPDVYAKLPKNSAGDPVIPFNDRGFPEFDSVVVELPATADGATSVTRGDFTLPSELHESTVYQQEKWLDSQMGITAEQRSAKGWTWHHHEDLGRMQLVPSSVHGDVRHTGGWAIWGGGKR